MNNVDIAPRATRELPGSPVGAFTTASPGCWVVRPVPRIAFYFIRSAMTGFIASASPYRNRVSLREAFEALEPDEGKLSRPVLRGPGSREAAWLLGTTGNWRSEDFHPARFTALSTAPLSLRGQSTRSKRLHCLSADFRSALLRGSLPGVSKMSIEAYWRLRVCRGPRSDSIR